MLLSAVSVLVVVQSSSEIPEGLMNNPVFYYRLKFGDYLLPISSTFFLLSAIYKINYKVPKRIQLHSIIFIHSFF